MKTNILILLALSTSAHLVSAAKPAIPVTNKNVVPKNIGVHPAVPSLVRTVTTAPINRSASAPSLVGTRPAPAFQGSGAAVKPGIKTSAGSSVGGNRLGHTTDPRLGNINQGAAGQDFQAACGMKQFGEARGLVPGFAGGFGPQGNRPVGPGAPDMTFGEGGFKGHDVRNPLDRSSGAGIGLTDIRGGAGSQNKGTETDRSHLSVRGQTLLGAYSPSGGSTRYGSTSSQTGESEHVGHSSNGRSSTTVTEQRDTRGRLTGTTLETGHAGSRSTDYKTVHFDGHGRAQDVVVNRENSRTGEQTKDVYGPGGNQQSHTSSRDVPTPRDTTPADGDGSKKNQGCERSNGDISMGGPIGPSVGEASGLSNLDLLRQFAEGRQTTVGGNMMTNARVSGNEVRPDSLGSGPRTTRGIGSPSLTNPEVNGGHTGGGDRPD